MYETSLIILMLVGIFTSLFRVTLGAFIALFIFFGGGALVIADLVEKLCS